MSIITTENSQDNFLKGVIASQANLGADIDENTATFSSKTNDLVLGDGQNVKELADQERKQELERLKAKFPVNYTGKAQVQSYILDVFEFLVKYPNGIERGDFKEDLGKFLYVFGLNLQLLVNKVPETMQESLSKVIVDIIDILDFSKIEKYKMDDLKELDLRDISDIYRIQEQINKIYELDSLGKKFENSMEYTAFNLLYSKSSEKVKLKFIGIYKNLRQQYLVNKIKNTLIDSKGLIDNNFKGYIEELKKDFPAYDFKGLYEKYGKNVPGRSVDKIALLEEMFLKN